MQSSTAELITGLVQLVPLSNSTQLSQEAMEVSTNTHRLLWQHPHTLPALALHLHSSPHLERMLQLFHQMQIYIFIHIINKKQPTFFLPISSKLSSLT